MEDCGAKFLLKNIFLGGGRDRVYQIHTSTGSCNASIREEESIVNFIEYRPLPAREFENAVIK